MTIDVALAMYFGHEKSVAGPTDFLELCRENAHSVVVARRVGDQRHHQYGLCYDLPPASSRRRLGDYHRDFHRLLRSLGTPSFISRALSLA